MKRILQIGMTANYAGTEAYIMNQYRKLDHSILTYDFLDIKDDIRQIACYDEIINNGDKVIKLPFPNRKKEGIIPYVRLAVWLMKNRNNYLGIAMNINIPNMAFPLVVARLVGYKKTIAHAHNTGYECKLSLIKRCFFEINRRMIRWAATDKWACSKEAGQFLFGNDRFKIINNGIDLLRFRFSLDRRKEIRKNLDWENKFVIGHIGRFGYQKNQEFVVELFKKLYRENNNMRLIMVGNGEQDPSLVKKIREEIEKNELLDVIKIIKPCHNIEQYYSAFDAFVFPSRFEGFGFVGLEAQANGVPCFFSSNIPKAAILTDLVRVISLDNIDIWKDELLKLSNMKMDDDYLQEKRTGNYVDDIASEGYDLDKQVRMVMNLYLS